MNHKIAIVYDWIDKWGGVERILLVLKEIFPEAVFFTSYYDSERAKWAKNFSLKTSFIQNLPNFIKKSRIISFLFYPFAFESFDFSTYDFVISVTSSFAKSIITKPETKHICYLLTPTRYLWLFPELYFRHKLFKIIIQPYLNFIRLWDLTIAQRPDKIFAISKTAAERCQKYYKRKSEIIYPPFDFTYWNKIKYQISQKQNKFLHERANIKNLYQIAKLATFKKYFLVVSRLEPYKRVDLVIKLFNRYDKALIIVGEGSQEKKLKKLAGKNIHFIKKVTDQQLGYLYSHAQGLIMPQEEDFGYVALEAQFFGCPVIAYKKGGVTETVIGGRTGIFFDQQTEKSLYSALERFDRKSYNWRYNINNIGLDNIKRFSKDKFVERFKRALY